MTMLARPRVHRCERCQRPIVFVRMDATGKSVPVDPGPDDGGNVVGLRSINGQLHGYQCPVTERVEPGYRRYMPHFATCPKPAPREPRPPKAPAVAAPRRKPEQLADVIPLFGVDRGR